MTTQVILALLMGCSILGYAHAKDSGSLVLISGYSDHGRISADIDEDEVDPDKYTEYSLDIERVRSIRVVLPKYYLYAHYTSMDAVDEQGRKYNNRFNSIAFGFAYEMQEYLTGSVHWYMLLDGGGGAARFNFDNPRSRAMGEVGAEVGLLFFRRFSVGLGIDYQLIGYPGETIAEGGYASANLGLHL
tara:strand:+ start:61164 stop:61727 length:564 start_codon:yes stop_codon:yes gene_type:complete